MSVEDLIEFADAAISRKMGTSLNSLTKYLLKECCQNGTKTYDQIALESCYSASYLKKKVIPELWQLLSDTFGEKVTKMNCRSVLEKYQSTWENRNKTAVKLESPEEQVPLASPFYIDPFRSQRRCYEEILEPGALVRIKGPRKIGKTSLLARLLAHAEAHRCRTIRLNLDMADSSVLAAGEKFLRWFCANAALQLDMEPQLAAYWDGEVGALVDCKLYFQSYLLAQIEQPIVLAVDEANRLFEYPALARDFFSLLRSWYQAAKDRPCWQKLRMIIVHSTDAYIPFDANRSPFNVGSVFELQPFTPAQVKELAQRHGLQLSPQELERIQTVLGGFPYLVRRLFYQAAISSIRVKILMENAATDAGIFSNCLHEQLQYLQTKPDLLRAYQQVAKAETPIMLGQRQAFQLKSLGLVNLNRNQVIASCELYRQYFGERLEHHGV